jgi:SAM-dependent methyltransferase
MRHDEHFKDHFSVQSAAYRQFRPTYPAALYAYLAQHAPAREVAWDCATGNGQAAMALAQHFRRVRASDASAAQIKQATPHPRIHYVVEPAEHAGLQDGGVDLITVAQAFHWFDHAAFFREAHRVLRAGGLLAVWRYHLLHIAPEIDRVLHFFYHDVVGQYWPAERTLIEQGCPPLPDSFDPIATPAFAMQADWRCEQLLGYLGTWSAAVRYQQATGQDPRQRIRSELQQAWGDLQQQRTVAWPLHLQLGCV